MNSKAAHLGPAPTPGKVLGGSGGGGRASEHSAEPRGAGGAGGRHRLLCLTSPWPSCPLCLSLYASFLFGLGPELSLVGNAGTRGAGRMAGRPPSRGVSGEAPWLPRPLLWGRPSCPPAPGLAKGAGVTPVSRRAGSPRGGPARPCLFLRRARFTGALRASGPEWTAVSSQRRGRCPLLRGVCDVSSSQKRDSDTAVVPLSAEGEGEARSGGAGARRESGAVGWPLTGREPAGHRRPGGPASSAPAPTVAAARLQRGKASLSQHR